MNTLRSLEFRLLILDIRWQTIEPCFRKQCGSNLKIRWKRYGRDVTRHSLRFTIEHPVSGKQNLFALTHQCQSCYFQNG
jgi:hypothetical protein